MKLLLLIVAAWASVYATAAFLLDYSGYLVVSSVVAFLALGGVFYLDHRDAERRRMAAHAVWLDFDDEHLREVD
jgi:ammonia channel protein AmtB